MACFERVKTKKNRLPKSNNVELPVLKEKILNFIFIEWTLENAEGAIKMDNPEKLATRRRKTKQKHNTICVGHHYSSNGCKTIHACTNVHVY